MRKIFPRFLGKKKKTRENEKEQECCLEGKKKWKRERFGFWEPQIFPFLCLFPPWTDGFLDFGDVVEGREKVMDGCR